MPKAKLDEELESLRLMYEEIRKYDVGAKRRMLLWLQERCAQDNKELTNG